MTRMIRLGIAGAALAFTSTARPCDVRGYDPAAERPTEGICPTVVNYANPPEATDYDVSFYQKYAAVGPEEVAGSGSGETVEQTTSRQESEEEFVQMVWTAP